MLHPTNNNFNINNTSGYTIELLNELHRDLIRAAPNDPLQFCSAWFQFKLEHERIQARSSSASSSSTATTTTTTTTTSIPVQLQLQPPSSSSSSPSVHNHHHHHLLLHHQHHIPANQANNVHLNPNTITTQNQNQNQNPTLIYQQPSHHFNPINPTYHHLSSDYPFQPQPQPQPQPQSLPFPAHQLTQNLNQNQANPAISIASLPQQQQQQQPLPNQDQSIQLQSYHSTYPSNHPNYYHSYHLPPPPQQQPIPINPPPQNIPPQVYSFSQPPPNNFPVNPTSIPPSDPLVHHPQSNHSITPQQSISTTNQLRSYSLARSNSVLSNNPVETPPRPTDPIHQSQTLITPTSYSSPTSNPRLPQQNLNRPQHSLSSPNHSLDSPAPTYHPHPATSPTNQPSLTLSNANNINPHQNLTSPTPHRLSPSNNRSSAPPPIDEDSDDSNSDESPHEPIVPAGYNFGRRVSVSAESLSPSSRSNGPIAPKVVIPKTVDQRKRIEASIKENLLFRNLDEEQHNDVLNAMTEVRVSKGTEVIVQGAVGDFFYVVEQGTFDVYVRGPPTYTYLPPSSNQSQGTLTLGVNNDPSNGSTTPPMLNPFAPALNRVPSSQELGSSIQRDNTPFNAPNSTGGTTLTHQAPSKKVHSYGPGGSFGELALMYNAPRAATVVATSQTATLWALDRVTFRSILIEHTARKRKMYENFLAEVPILVSLSPTEISKIADSLEERSFAEGVDVIKEGEVGREFFIIEAGRAEVYKKRNNGEGESGEEEIVGILGKGDHFGELALLNSAPRAATVRAATGTGRLRVAALGEKAFTRLLGPVIDILSRHAESHYGKDSNPYHRPAMTTGINGSRSSSTMSNSVAKKMKNGNGMVINGPHHEIGGSSTGSTILNGTSAHHIHSPLSSSVSLPPHLPPSSSSSSSSSSTSTPIPSSNPNPNSISTTTTLTTNNNSNFAN